MRCYLKGDLLSHFIGEDIPGVTGCYPQS
ncbi:hypothetical protein LCGC14_2018960, partial [marine sediment metagenome]